MASRASSIGPTLTRLGVALVEYARLIRLDRPVGFWLLLWPALWGLWLATHGRPHEQVFAVFVAGVFLMRSAGCAINDFADRRVDGQVWRTRDRPIAAGRLRPAAALVVYVVLSAAALALVLTLNRLTQIYALGAAALTIIYPFLKRYTSLPQIWLGAAFSWSIPMAFAAETGRVPRVAWLLFLAGVVWAVVYDTMYAMADRPDDLKAGIRSSAILFGEADRVVIGILQILVLYALWLVGSNAELGHWYRFGLGAGALLFIYQQWLIRDREPVACLAAFRNNQWFGLVVFLGLALDAVLRQRP